MFTGRDALFSIEQAISRTRSDERSLDAALYSTVADAARYRRAEAEGFRALARARLDAITRDQVIGELDETERQAVALLEGRRKAVEALSQRRDETQAALDKAEAAKHERDQEFADALEALDERRDHTAERMKADARWREAKAAVEAAVQVAANADKKATDAEADLTAKGKPYEDDPLFMYLWSKHAGQADDTSGHVVRLLDSSVAQLVGYRDARANYTMLREIPLRLREHAVNKQHDVDDAKARLAATEREALVADGIGPLETKAEAAHAAMAAAESEVTKITTELGKIEAERQWAIQSDDEKGLKRAVDLLAQSLARENLRELYQDAVRTASKADDQAISSISAARTAMQKADGEVTRIRAQMSEMARRRNELEGARDRARSTGYDNPRGTFDGGRQVIGDVIGGILSGAVQGAMLDRILRDNYRPPHTRVDPDFGRWGGVSSFPSGWGGAQSSGRARPTGGGWRTGGKF